MQIINNLPNNLILFEYPFFLLSLFVVILFIFLLVFVFISILRKERNSSVDPEALKQKAYSEALKIIDEAKMQSLKILSDSQVKAQESIDTVEDINEDTKRDISKRLKDIYEGQTDVLQNVGQDLVTSYKKAIEEGKREGIKTIDDATKMLKTELSQEVDTLKDTLRRETIETQKELDRKLKEGYEKVEQEIQQYKQEKVKELNDDILNVLANISSKVIGNAINQVEHEAFILKTVEEELKKSGLKS